MPSSSSSDHHKPRLLLPLLLVPSSGDGAHNSDRIELVLLFNHRLFSDEPRHRLQLESYHRPFLSHPPASSCCPCAQAPPSTPCCCLPPVARRPRSPHTPSLAVPASGRAPGRVAVSTHCYCSTNGPSPPPLACTCSCSYCCRHCLHPPRPQPPMVVHPAPALITTAAARTPAQSRCPPLALLLVAAPHCSPSRSTFLPTAAPARAPLAARLAPSPPLPPAGVGAASAPRHARALFGRAPTPTPLRPLHPPPGWSDGPLPAGPHAPF
nr:formin-like protein 6 [Aegilops tauschii subsp. strangulata]